jgi:fibronectin type 3 domain-containing protein
MKRLIPAFLLAIALLSCSLERENPLDPRNGDTKVPSEVTGITVTSYGNDSSQKWVQVTWSDGDVADGYYIYRSMSYNGEYQKIASIPQADSLFYRDYNVFAPNYYYYSIAAYKAYPEYSDEPLEGRKSAPLVVRVK